MDHQYCHSSPTQTMMYSNTTNMFVAYPDTNDCGIANKAAVAAASSTRSPNTVIFAVDELSSVFRVADDHNSFTIHHHPSSSSHQDEEPSMSNNHNSGATTMLRRARYLTPSSFTTDGELSTFSEDTEEDASSDTSYSGSDDNNDELLQHQHNRFRFYPRRRRSAMSIFRSPTNGTKRRCDEFEHQEDDDDIDISNPTKRSCSAPLLCHANPIGSDDGCDDEEALSIISSTSSSASIATSPFKRICRTSGNSTADTTSTTMNNIPFPSLFNEMTSTLPPTTTTATNNITLTHLHHPLSLESSSPFAKLFPKNTEYQG
jgi:hypothetical protein